MTDQLWLSVLSFLLAIISALFGWFVKMVWAKLQALEANTQNTALATFLGRDAERERAWWVWREVVDNRLDDKKATLKAHEHRITMLERNGHG